MCKWVLKSGDGDGVVVAEGLDGGVVLVWRIYIVGFLWFLIFLLCG